MKKIILLVVIALFLFYLNLPVLNYGFLGLPIILLALCATTIILFTKYEVVSDKKIPYTKAQGIL